MKTLKISFFILIALMGISCQRTTHTFKNFIQLEEKSFTLDGDTFFPIMLNYIVEFRYINQQVILSPAKVYEDPYRYESQNPDDVQRQLNGHFQLISEMGFNTLRICFDRISQDEEGHYFYDAEAKRLYLQKDYRQIFKGLDQMLNEAEATGLHVMLLIKAPMDKELKQFTQRLLRHLRHNPTLFAYDFMNEPLYFDDNPNRTKEEAIQIVTEWRQMMDKYAPHQLITMGLSEPIEVFEWDPSLLPIDFIAFHTYHPLRVPNEIYWFSSYANKPWMVGETSLPADQDSISYEEQRQFMREVYQYTRDCGGLGLGWWEFQEVPDDGFEAQYTALLNHEGVTYTKKGHYKILGSVKPAVSEIARFAGYHPKDKVRPVNYYNMMGYNNYLLHGTILDKKTHQPIEGAVIRGWNEDWSVGLNTFTDSLGHFTLYSNDRCVHFEISAPGMSHIKFSNFNISYKPVGHWKEEEFPKRTLEYHQISYQPFVMANSKDTNHVVFNFNPSLFNQHKMEGTLTPLYLKNISINQ